MPVYVIAQIAIRDRDEYAKYQEGFLPIFARYKGELLVVDDAPRVVEGEWPWTRSVVIRFPDEDEARRWYESPEYQEIARHRLRASTSSVIVAQGFAT